MPIHSPCKDTQRLHSFMHKHHHPIPPHPCPNPSSPLPNAPKPHPPSPIPHHPPFSSRITHPSHLHFIIPLHRLLITRRHATLTSTPFRPLLRPPPLHSPVSPLLLLAVTARPTRPLPLLPRSWRPLLRTADVVVYDSAVLAPVVAASDRLVVGFGVFGDYVPNTNIFKSAKVHEVRDSRLIGAAGERR